jgi:hypothetical protein
MSNTATLKANFKSTIPAVCLLTVNNDGHGTTSSAGLNYVVGGAAVSIFATPASGYEFSSWAVTSGTATLDNASKSVTTVKVYSLKATIMANFKVKVIPTYQLTITNDGHGTTTPTGVISVKYGVLTAIKANPASGYEFLTWSQLSGIVTLDSLWTRASNTAKLFNGNVTLRANFKARAKLAKSVAAKESASALPNEYGLNQNYPNPFNPSTLISFAIPSTGSELGSQEQKQVSVSLNVYDMRGQLIKNLVNESVTGGLYAIAWDGKSNSGKQVASGQYLCKIISGNFTKEIRMTLMK